jgi:hypothetical protein
MSVTVVGDKRQFKGASTRRSSFDRKVQDTGYTRTLSIGKIIPKDWAYVRLTPIQIEKQWIILRIDKLLGDEKLACYPKTCAGHRQNP